MNVQACIFDLDGVVVDTAKYHYQAWKRLAQLFDFEFTEEANEGLKGISRIDSLNRLLQLAQVEFDQEEKERLLEIKNTWYLEYVSKMDRNEILPGVLNFLNQITEQGIKTAIGSASKNAYTILNQIGMSDSFDAIIGGQDVTFSKPHPEVFLKGAEALKVAPENIIVFEDSQKGLEAADSGGFIPVGVGSPENLNLARLIIPGFDNLNFSDLVRALHETNPIKTS